MTDQFDVIIAGAGPAGAQCARDLASRDYDVLVLETEPEAEFPRQSNKSTAGTFPSMMASFSIPDEVVMNFTDKVVLESPSEAFVQPQAGAVLDFAEFKRFLVRDGQKRGATYRFDARVSAPVLEDSNLVGVTYNGSETARAEVVIDATGPAATLAKQLGVSNLERERQAIGIEYEFEGIDIAHPDYADLTDAMMLRLDHDLAPGGYSWIFHTGGDTAKVGLCYIQNNAHRKRAREGLTIDGYLDHWLDTDPRFAEATRLEGRQHRGSAHIQPPGRLYTDSFLAIGDTVPTVDPLWGEGINKGMRSGRVAAITVDSALTPDTVDTSATAMAEYADRWHAEVAPDARTRLLMTELLYFAPNERYDTLLADLDEADMETLSSLNGGDWKTIARFVHATDLPLLAKFARQRLLG